MASTRPATSRRYFPDSREGLKGSYYYADAMMLDDEVVLETIVDARRGATRSTVRAKSVGGAIRPACSGRARGRAGRGRAPFDVRARGHRMRGALDRALWRDRRLGMSASSSRAGRAPDRALDSLADRALPGHVPPDRRIIFAIRVRISVRAPKSSSSARQTRPSTARWRPFTRTAPTSRTCLP